MLSSKWKWFGLGSGASAVLATLGAQHLLAARLAQLGDNPDMALPVATVVMTWAMTFFGLLVPLVALVGTVVVLVDGIAGRSRG